MRRGRPIAVAIVVALLVVIASTVGAQTSADITLQPSTASVGSVVDVTGAGFPGGGEALLYLDRSSGAPLIDGVPLSRSGTFATEFVVPLVALGDHAVIGCWRTSPSALPTCPTRETLRVVAPPRPPPTTALPPTTSVAPPRPTDPPIASPTTVLTPTTPASTAPTTTSGGSLGIATTTTHLPPGPGGVAAQTTAPGLGFGDLLGDATLPDLRVTRLEVTQSVQNLENEMPLVTGHATVVRVYVRADGAVGNISGALLVEKGGNEVAVVPPANGPISTTVAGSDRLDSNGTLNFVLPPVAVGSTGSTKLTAFVYSAHPSTPFDNEPSAQNNFRSETVSFQAGTDLAVRLFPVHVHEDPDPAAPDVTFGQSFGDVFTVGHLFVVASRYLPVASISALPGPVILPPNHAGGPVVPPLFSEFDLSLKSHGSIVNAVIFDHWEQSTPASDYEQFYGLVAVDPPMAYGGLSNTTVAHGRASTEVDADSPWYQPTGGKTLAHELAHNVGFDHNLCSGSEPNGGPVEPYPYTGPPCRLAPLHPEGWYGFDTVWQSLAYLPEPHVISNDPDEAPPNRGFPVMGYKNPRWADPYFWCRQLVHFGTGCTALPIPENDVDPPDGPPIASGDDVEGQDGWLRVSSLLDPDAGSATLLDTRRVGEPEPRVLDEYVRRRTIGEPSDVVVQLVDATGEPLGAATPLVDTHTHDEELFTGDDDGVVVHEYVPWVADPAAIELRRDGTVLDRRAVSGGVPTIEVATPNALDAPFDLTWTASDPDGDPLRFSVRYSHDGGDTWTLLAPMLSEPRFTMESFALVAGGEDAIFEVTANDGVHTASALTEPRVAPDGPPTIAIVSPNDERIVPLHQPVVLRAQTFDWEDGIANRPDVSWESSRDGGLGEGEFVLALELSAGVHVITATATDAAGQTAAATITVVVDEARAMPTLDGDDAAELLARLRAGPPDEASGATGTWIVAGLVLGVFAALVTVILRVLRTRRTGDTGTG